ncbi:MAG: Xylose operon regulatory protein [Planctomycetota bacterium]|jgi:LacI family transcriptional regulator
MAMPRVLILGAPTPFGLHAGLMRRVVAAASRQPWRVRLQVAPPKPGPLPAADGYLAAAYTADLVERLHQVGGPVINLDGAIDALLPRAGTDPERLADTAARHLLAVGPCNAAFVGHRDRFDSRRLGEAFLRRMSAAGLPARSLELPGSWRTMEETINDHRVRRWLLDLPAPCALLTWSEGVAVHIADLCHGTRRLGHDLLLLSAGDDPDLLTGPGISGIARDLERIAATAVTALASAMRGGVRPPQSLLVPPLAVLERPSTQPALVRDPAIGRAVELLRGESDRGADVAAIARAVGIPARSFRRRFAQAVGRSPAAERDRLRLDRARGQLAAGHPLSEVARQCGYGRADSLRRALDRADRRHTRPP